jgi:hypothetical protein
MRTIKLFEDFSQDFVKELKDFCEMYLAYLTDEGFEVKITDEKGVYDLDTYVLDIKKVSAHANYTVGNHGVRNIDNSFKWGEVVDHFIPFYQMLSREYDLVKSARGPYGSINLRQEMTLGTRVGWIWKNYVDVEDLDPDLKIDLIQIPIKAK